eukprot:220165-Prymnesium_polylepis.2
MTTPGTSTFAILPTPGNCTLGGTLLRRTDEESIRGLIGGTLLLRLVKDTWKADETGTGLEDHVAQAILASAASTSDELGGWNSVVRPYLLSAATSTVERLKRHTVQITLPQF